MTAHNAPFVLLDDRLAPDERAYLFENPRVIIRCDRPEDILACLDRLDEAIGQGGFAAGFCAYELGYAFEPRLAGLQHSDHPGPLLWFGVFEAPHLLNGRQAAAFLRSRTTGGHRVSDLAPGHDETAHADAIGRIHDYIHAGDVYQVNMTFPLRFRVEGDPVSLYAALRARQRVAHGALIRTEDSHILSLSPELFFETDASMIRTRPMKGTVRRAPDPDDDAGLAAWLQRDPKNRAENLMIVDLLRNDIGRVAEIGSVRVPSLFRVETYETLHTMTSTVEARLTPGHGLRPLLKALFPCGSITGAPKIRAMEIIRELEAGPRGTYTGAVGMAGPDGSAHFNVAIRTIRIDATGDAVMGIGGGIVADSEPSSEYQEALLKARFLMDEAEPFALIETMRGTRTGGIPLLDLHLARLAHSAQWFAMPYDERAVRTAILDKLTDQQADDALRLRLTVDWDGRIAITATPIGPEPQCRRFVLADTPIDAADPFYGHKTTRRTLYDDTHRRLTNTHDVEEVVFLNRWGEIAEGSRSTVFVERGGMLITPPLACGALPGVMRTHIMRTRPVTEQMLYPDDLRTAPRVYLANAVWGLAPAHMVTDYRSAPALSDRPA